MGCIGLCGLEHGVCVFVVGGGVGKVCMLFFLAWWWWCGGWLVGMGWLVGWASRGRSS